MREVLPYGFGESFSLFLKREIPGRKSHLLSAPHALYCGSHPAARFPEPKGRGFSWKRQRTIAGNLGFKCKSHKQMQDKDFGGSGRTTIIAWTGQRALGLGEGCREVKGEGNREKMVPEPSQAPG